MTDHSPAVVGGSEAAESSAVAELQAQLLGWYATAWRRLPWRGAGGSGAADPYAVLVSECMLQLTRAAAVVDYYQRWMLRWPTLVALANATEADVLAQWTGLGYYNRARNLHATAKAVVARHGGVLPSEPAALAALPGVGPYTVGALRSIAFAQAAALVDGNVARVYCRLFARTDDWSTAGGKKGLWQLAEALAHAPVAGQQPSAWSQALMELGATVCRPRAPSCEMCPVAGACRALASGKVQTLPVRSKRRPPQPCSARYAFVARGRPEGLELLLGRRPTGGRWGGLWEPPGTEGATASARLVAWMDDVGLTAGETLAPLVHTLTHRRYTVVVVVAQAVDTIDVSVEVDGAFDAIGRFSPTASTAPAAPAVPADLLDSLSALGYTAARWCSPDAALSSTGGLSRLGQRIVDQAVAHLRVQPVPRVPGGSEAVALVGGGPPATSR